MRSLNDIRKLDRATISLDDYVIFRPIPGFNLPRDVKYLGDGEYLCPIWDYLTGYREAIQSGYGRTEHKIQVIPWRDVLLQADSDSSAPISQSALPS